VAPPQAVEAEDDELIGKVVAGRYRVLEKLGEGGMGAVYLAEHVTIEKKVALKVLLHDYARKADLKERFLQEARAAARIGHENIVDITDFGDTPNHSVFFAMEFLEGVDLAQLIRTHGPIPWARAKPILLQICRALGAAHSKGVIHRDMKPENIYLIEREGRSDFVKLLDFGIAKMSASDRESRLTRTGMIFGTPEYMSPEQAQGNKPDHRVDVYAVGVIMYEMLTGRVPFKADTFMGILTKHIFEQPLPPSQMNPDVVIPVEAERIVLKAMDKEREQRFQSMAEMAAAITSASGRVTRPTGDISTADPRIMQAAPRPAGATSQQPPVSRAPSAPAARPWGERKVPGATRAESTADPERAR
jgi:serine/threonine-protein kinase